MASLQRALGGAPLPRLGEAVQYQAGSSLPRGPGAVRRGGVLQGCRLPCKHQAAAHRLPQRRPIRRRAPHLQEGAGEGLHLGTGLKEDHLQQGM